VNTVAKVNLSIVTTCATQHACCGAVTMCAPSTARSTSSLASKLIFRF
jgi:hypothetical protein